jgi:hypothetical protein
MARWFLMCRIKLPSFNVNKVLDSVYHLLDEKLAFNISLDGKMIYLMKLIQYSIPFNENLFVLLGSMWCYRKLKNKMNLNFVIQPISRIPENWRTSWIWISFVLLSLYISPLLVLLPVLMVVRFCWNVHWMWWDVIMLHVWKCLYPINWIIRYWMW